LGNLVGDASQLNRSGSNEALTRTQQGVNKVRTISRAAFAALGLCMVLTISIAAQAKVEDLRLGTTSNPADAVAEDDQAIFPAGIKSLHAHFDYSGAARQRIGLKVSAPGGVPVFSAAKAYSGSGSERIEISGVGMYRELATNLVIYAEATDKSAKDLKNSTRTASIFGVYLNGVTVSTNYMRDSAAILKTWDLASGPEGDLGDLEDAIAQLTALVEDAADLKDDDEDGREGLAELIAGQAEDATVAAESLEDYGSKVNDLAIPESEADLGTSYLVQVTVDGTPAMSREFWVTNETLPEPTKTLRPPTSSPDEQPSASRTPLPRTPRASSATDTPEMSTEDRFSLERNPTAQARATAVAENLATEAAGEVLGAPTGDPVELGTTNLVATPFDSSQAAPEGMPTWTPVPGASPELEPGIEGEGPNLAVLGLGILALVAIAVWLRRRV
jgi:hypothetical protein